MRYFVRRSTKGGCCLSLIQNYSCSISDEVFNIISRELNVSGNICESLDKYIENVNKHKEIYKEKYKS